MDYLKKSATALLLGIFLALTVGLMTSKAIAEVCPAGLVSYWKLDDGAGTTATDSVGTNNGTLIDNPAWTSGKVNGALRFRLNGVNNYVRVNNAPSLNVTGGITLEAWIYPMNVLGGAQDIISKHGSGNGLDDSYTMQLTQTPPQKVLFLLSSGGDLSSPGYVNLFSTGTVENNQWYHLAATWDGSMMKIFINGLLQGETPFQGPIHQSELPLGIGRNGGDGWYEYFDGIIDEAALYNRALTPAEITQHYQNGLSGGGYCQTPPLPSLTCQGFGPPAGLGPDAIKQKKVIPLKATLLNGTVPVTNMDVAAPPVIKVLYDNGTGSPIDVTANALPAGKSTEGGRFLFDGTWWQFNLQNNFSQPGTYTVSMASGDATTYSIIPTCTMQFVIK